jgi:hypothetical protein
MIRKKIVYIDSKSQLTSGVNTWTEQIDINFQDDYDRVTVLQAQIPVSYYVVGAGSNKFTLIEGSQSVVITITSANYNVFNFATTVQALLNANSPNGYTYTMAYPNQYTSPDTGLFSYTVNSIARSVALQFPKNSSLTEQFGFYGGSTNYFTVSGVIQILSSTAVVNFTPETSLFIHCNFVDGETTSTLSDVLVSIYAFNVQPYACITYVNPCPLETSRRLTSRDRNLVFSITDENNGQIFMNGQNILLVLMFYKEDSINRSVEQYIAMKTKLLELEVNQDVEKEANKPLETSLQERNNAIEDRERKLDAREETLKIREESINNLQNNKDNEEVNEEGTYGEEEYEKVDSNVENRPENQEEISNNREEEILDQG